MTEMPQAFADAVCNMRAKTLRYGPGEWHELADDHTRHRYRGMEGINGVCCDVCKDRARNLWAEFQRIHDTLAGG